MELAGDLLLEREFHLGLQFTGMEHFKEISLSQPLHLFSTSSIKPPSFLYLSAAVRKTKRNGSLRGSTSPYPHLKCEFLRLECEDGSCLELFGDLKKFIGNGPYRGHQHSWEEENSPVTN